MTKSKIDPRAALVAKLEALDNSTEISKLNAEVTRLTTENASLLDQRKGLERRLADFEKNFTAIREAIRNVEVRSRPAGRNPEFHEAGVRAVRMGNAAVSAGIRKGSHDPETGLPWTAETKPLDLSTTTQRISKTELTKAFPMLAVGGGVEVTEAEVIANAEADASLLPVE
jgi:hypothetical protein